MPPSKLPWSVDRRRSVIHPDATESDPFIPEKETAQRIADDLNRPDAQMIWSAEKVPTDFEDE